MLDCELVGQQRVKIISVVFLLMAMMPIVNLTASFMDGKYKTFHKTPKRCVSVFGMDAGNIFHVAIK